MRVVATALLLTLACAADADGYVYWANSTPGESLPVPAIGRAALDGTGADQAFISVAPASGPTNPCGVAVDGRFVYWANATQPSGSGTTIGRARIDGSAPQVAFITGADTPCGVAVDGTHIYWANYSGDSIGRANLDGTGVLPNWLATGSGSGPCGVAVDADHVYWANLGGGYSLSSVGRAQLDGTGLEPDWVPAVAPCGVDVNDDYVYWANFIQGYGSSIGRARIDGSDPQIDFIAAENGTCSAPCLAGPVGVAVDDHHIYWANQTSDSIGRAQLDGTNVDRAFIAGASAPVGVAVDDLPHPSPTPPPPQQHASPPPVSTVSPPAIVRRSVMRFRRSTRSRRRGTVTLRLRVAGPGKVVVSGRRVRRISRRVQRARTVRLVVRARGRALRTLRRRGRVHVTARVAYRADGLRPTARRRHLTLIRRHR